MRKIRDIDWMWFTAIVVLVVIVFAFVLATPHDYVMDVKSVHWEYVIQIQELRAVHEEGWSFPPGDAYNVDKYWKKHGKTAVGTNSNGDTIYEDDYDWYYVYTVNRWVNSRQVTTVGYDKSPYWGEYELYESDNVMGLGDERVIAQTQTYAVSGIIIGSKDTDIVSVDVPKNIWEKITTNDDLLFKKRIIGHPYEIQIAK